MSKTVMYRFAELHRPVEGGTCIDRAWIPSKFAVPDKYLEIMDHKGRWTNGWKVVQVSSTESEERFINKRPCFGSLDDNARSRKIGV